MRYNPAVPEILVAILAGPVLWLAGAIMFDGVHWVLHRMLRSRFAWLRALAWPHSVHHAWIDRDLATNRELQRANIWCHLVPEYLTQLAFTGVIALVLPLPFAIVLTILQTVLFACLLSFRGRDINHRPPAVIDAHPRGWTTPPSYHLLHHVWPDAHFSAYTKLVDWVVGGGSQITGRRFVWRGPYSKLGSSLRVEVENSGGVDASQMLEPHEIDVLVLLDADAPLEEQVEKFIAETGARQLPPEIWALRTNTDDPVARHYVDDVRVSFRTLVASEYRPLPDPTSPPAGRRAARRALFWIRRDAHVVALNLRSGSAAPRSVRHVAPRTPAGARSVRHRSEMVADTEHRAGAYLNRAS